MLVVLVPAVNQREDSATCPSAWEPQSPCKNSPLLLGEGWG